MVLNEAKKRSLLWMRWLPAFLLLPFVAKVQELKRNTTDPASNKREMETFPVNLAAASGVRMDACLSASGNSFFLTLMGSGKGTNTIDIDNQTVLTLDNDSAVVVRSTAVQGFESKDFVNTYKHEYAITPQALQELSRHNLRRVRKYSMREFADIDVDEGSAANLKTLSAFFLQEIKKAGLLKETQSAAAFPGGKEVWLSFINRNLKTVPQLAAGTKKTGAVAFEVNADGSIQNIRIRETADPSFDTELLRILKRMPRWKPSVVNGKPVPATISQRVVFSQQNDRVRVSFQD